MSVTTSGRLFTATGLDHPYLTWLNLVSTFGCPIPNIAHDIDQSRW